MSLLKIEIQQITDREIHIDRLLLAIISTFIISSKSIIGFLG